MIELTKMLRMFADDFNVVLQNAIPSIVSSLKSLAEAFKNNLPNIIVLMERYVNDLAKTAKSASGQTDWKKLNEGMLEYKENNFTAKQEKEVFFDPIFGGEVGKNPNPKSKSQLFQEQAIAYGKLTGKKFGPNDRLTNELIADFEKVIKAGLGTNKSPSTVGMARPENAAYSNVADVGREAVRRAFEGSRQQDLLRQQNRDDTKEGTKQGVIEGLAADRANKSSPIFQRNGQIPWAPPDNGDNFGGLGQYTKDPAFAK